MTFKSNTGTTIQEAFNQYHRLNPEIYEEFKTQAKKAINLGRSKISFKAILNWIRWNKYIEVQEPTLFNQEGVRRKFKINDAYSSRYARLFAEEYPEYENKIDFRELRS